MKPKWTYLLIFGLLGLSATAGCQMGRMNASLNREGKVPKLDVAVLPKQWEPEVEAEPESTDETDSF